MTSSGNRIFTDIIVTTGALLKRGNLGNDMPTERTPGKDTSRDQSDVFTRQKLPKMASEPPEGRLEVWSRLVLIDLRRKQP